MFTLSKNLSKLYSLLKSVSVTDNITYVEILSLLPAGLAAKLRITPGNDLVAKLAYFLNVLSIANRDETLDFDYHVISIENLEETNYFFDHDAIV